MAGSPLSTRYGSAAYPADRSQSQYGPSMLPLGPGKSGSNHPAFVACLAGLLRWPDRDQAQHLPQGYPSVGKVEPCGVFQQIHQSDKAGITTWSAGAVDLQRLLRSPPPKNADVILSIT